MLFRHRECCAPHCSSHNKNVWYIIKVATVLLVLRALFYMQNRWGEDGSVMWQQMLSIHNKNMEVGLYGGVRIMYLFFHLIDTFFW